MEKNKEIIVPNIGVYVSNLGNVYRDENGEEKIDPEIDISGYLFIKDIDLNLTSPSSEIIRKSDLKPIKGKYVHRMVAYSFLDKTKLRDTRYEVDHIDMNHENNSVENLDLVYKAVNLFRAWKLTGGQNCLKRYSDYMATLSDEEKWFYVEYIKKYEI